MNWDDLRYFLALSRTQTLKLAAIELQVDQASVGRRIRSLEEKIGSKLFKKSSSGFFLTNIGERILMSVTQMEEVANDVNRQIFGQDEKVEGDIRIALPGALANHLIIPALTKFREQYPRINIQLITGPEVVNLSKREADIAFRLVRPLQHELVVKKIGDVHLNLYGHASLVKNQPTSLESLSQYSFVGLYDYAMSSLERSLREKLNPHLDIKLLTAAWSSVFYSLSAKLGIGILPDFLATKNKELKKIDFLPPGKTVLWAVTHPDLQKNAKIRAFLDYMIPEIKENL